MTEFSAQNNYNESNGAVFTAPFLKKMDELTLIKNRFTDLAERSYERGIYTYSEFLNVAQQSELKKMRLPVKTELFGGYENAERAVAVFGSEEDFGYECSPPIVFIRIEPLQMKFADNFTHRDFLGSLMALGIKRETLGDIIISENTAYLVCLETIADYVIFQLDKVKHTNVKCSLCDSIPSNVLPKTEDTELIVSSERLDVLISAVYNLSRNESQKLIEAEKVYINSVLSESASLLPEVGAVISVRGFGRFVYNGIIRTTKKGRNVIAVSIF